MSWIHSFGGFLASKAQANVSGYFHTLILNSVRNRYIYSYIYKDNSTLHNTYKTHYFRLDLKSLTTPPKLHDLNH
jgi:hypothetical protein